MSIPGYQQVTATISPTSLGDTYATHDQQFGLGGWRSVTDNTERDAISDDRRSEGMAVYVNNTGLTWILDADLISWNQFAPGSIPPSDIMQKSTYDVGDTGTVDDSKKLGGQLPAYYLDLTNAALTGTLPQVKVNGLSASFALKENKAEKGVANGYVPLNAGITIDPIYLGVTVSVPLEGWNANTNTPALSDGTGSANEYCFVTVAGTSNLGSGALVCAVGNFIYHDGAKWNLVPTTGFGVNSITTDLGFQTGSTTIDDTSYIAPSTDRNYVTDDQLAAFPTGATGADQLVKQSDLAAAIVVGNTFVTPELYADGQTLGTGILRTLTSLGYNNGTAATAFPKVAADPRFSLDVTVQDIDWISWQEMCCNQRDLGFWSITTPGGRCYTPYASILPPEDQTAIAQARRSHMFIYDFNTSVFKNTTGVSFPCFLKFPVDHTQANGLQLDYAYHFKNGYFIGNNTASESDVFIKLGGTEGSTFDRLKGEQCGIFIDAQFCLQVGFSHINVESYGKYGIAIRDGLYTGGGANTDQSNNADVFKFRSVHGSGKSAVAGIYVQGNRNCNIKSSGFEGFNGAQMQIYYNQSYPTSGTLATTVKNILYMESIDFENAGASRAAIRAVGNNATVELNRFNTQVSSADTVALVELNAYNSINGGMTACIHGARNYNPGYKFRQLNNGGPTQKWEVYATELNNNSSLIAPENWDTAFAGSSIPTTYSYTPVL